MNTSAGYNAMNKAAKVAVQIQDAVWTQVEQNQNFVKLTRGSFYTAQIHDVPLFLHFVKNTRTVPFFRFPMETERMFLSILMGVACLLVSCA